jgi:prepilin-type N-terminal cleavage/methylation domain-containing protein
MTTLRRTRGFTLLELMVVVVIVGSILLLVPANLTGFGARSRLENAANTLAGAVAAAREQAILDGYEVRMEIGWYRDEDGRHLGHRWLFTNVPPPRPEGSEEEDEERQQELRAERGRERQWLHTTWHQLDGGLLISGISEEATRWQKLSDGEPYQVAFRPDGSVQKAFAIRIESQDLGGRREDRSLTVVVNGLTSEATVEDGQKELPRKLDFREIQ